MAGKKKLDKDRNWIGEMEGYSRQIWLAGLGAYAKMGKEGAKLFETLVRDGEEAEKTARTEIDKQVEVLKERVGKSSKAARDPVETARSRVEKSCDKLLGRWGELEQVLDKRLDSAVSRLGVPSRAEIQALEEKVDALSSAVFDLLAAKPGPAKLSPKAKPAVVSGAGTPAASEPVVEKAREDVAAGKPKTAPRRRAASSAASKTAGSNASGKPSGAKASNSEARSSGEARAKAKTGTKANTDKGSEQGAV